MWTNSHARRRGWIGFLLLTLGIIVMDTPALTGDREAAKGAYREGNTLLDQCRFAEAAAAYDRALTEDPQYAEAYHNRALAHEMVDRQKALQDWRRFLEIGKNNPSLKWDVGRAEARVQLIEAGLALPDLLRPSRYVAAAGDYYWEVVDRSTGEGWRTFPVKVFLGNAPEIKWQQGVREAYDIWAGIFPLELTVRPEDADIRFGWEQSRLMDPSHAGEELDWVQVKRVGDQLTGRRIAIIRMDLSRRWSKDEMRAIALHEMGHALGIKGHSPNKKDIMYWQMQEKAYQIHVPGPYPLFWRTLVKNPSQRDINTLLRLYNVAGPMRRFP